MGIEDDAASFLAQQAGITMYPVPSSTFDEWEGPRDSSFPSTTKGSEYGTMDLGNLANLRANVTLDGRCQQIEAL